MKARRILPRLMVLLVVVMVALSSCSDSNRSEAPQASYRAENEYMQLAIDEARDGIYNGDGGPFGCVIVRDGEVVGKGHNRVLAENDSTCHGEMVAIRDAEEHLDSYDLTGCELYTTGEPCTMCLAASRWANIEHIYYGCTLDDNASIGFRDVKIDQELGGRDDVQNTYLEELDREACLKLFEEYGSMEDRVIY